MKDDAVIYEVRDKSGTIHTIRVRYTYYSYEAYCEGKKASSAHGYYRAARALAVKLGCNPDHVTGDKNV